MKKIINLFFLVLIFLVTACQYQKSGKDIIRVGVFDKNGDSPECIEDAMEALKIDKDIEPRIVSAAEIMSGAADDIDVFLFPGGSGRSETGSLGEQGQQKIIDFVKKDGKGVIGICAGAYMLSETPGYPCLAISGGEAIDIEHDHRGHGIVKFTLTGEGKKIFHELKNRDTCYSQYYEGPVLIPAKKSNYKYVELAVMMSDVHTVEGTPAGMTVNRPFIIITDVEKGKVASIVGHPESTPGMRWIIPRLARVVAGEKNIGYDKNVIRPEIYSKEILFTPELLLKQDEARSSLLKSKPEKLKAMQELVDICAWSATKWVPPMLRDKDFDVRLLAAKLIVYMERTCEIDDMKAAVACETNPQNKKKLQQQLQLLENMLPKK